MHDEGDENNAPADPRWDRAIELLLDGATHKRVAEVIGVHRNTVTNYKKDSRFRIALARRSEARLAELKLRRALVTRQLVDRLAAVARTVLDVVERDPADPRAQRAAKLALRNYREARRIEAIDVG